MLLGAPACSVCPGSAAALRCLAGHAATGKSLPLTPHCNEVDESDSFSSMLPLLRTCSQSSQTRPLQKSPNSPHTGMSSQFRSIRRTHNWMRYDETDGVHSARSRTRRCLPLKEMIGERAAQLVGFDHGAAGAPPTRAQRRQRDKPPVVESQDHLAAACKRCFDLSPA